MFTMTSQRRFRRVFIFVFFRQPSDSTISETNKRTCGDLQEQIQLVQRSAAGDQKDPCLHRNIWPVLN